MTRDQSLGAAFLTGLAYLALWPDLLQAAVVAGGLLWLHGWAYAGRAA